MCLFFFFFFNASCPLFFKPLPTFQLNSLGYTNLATPRTIFPESNTHESCNLMLLCSLSGSHTNSYFYSSALCLIILVVSYLGSEATVIYLSSQNILFMVSTKKLRKKIQFPLRIFNLLNCKKNGSNYLMLHKRIIDLRILNIRGPLYWIKLFYKEQNE